MITSVWVPETAGTEDLATSMILSVISANFQRFMVASAEVSTIRTLVGTLVGERCMKTSQRGDMASSDIPSLSPKSCCIHLSSCVGFLVA